MLELDDYHKDILEDKSNDCGFNGWIEYRNDALTEGNTICVNHSFNSYYRFYVIEIITEENKESTHKIDKYNFQIQEQY